MSSVQIKTPLESLPPDIQALIRRLRRDAKKYRQLYQDLKRKQPPAKQ
jgi:hypothetical protein